MDTLEMHRAADLTLRHAARSDPALKREGGHGPRSSRVALGSVIADRDVPGSPDKAATAAVGELGQGSKESAARDEPYVCHAGHEPQREMKIIVVADDERSFREALKRLMETDHEPMVFYEAATGQEAVLLAREVHPDAVLLDLSMPDSGLESARRIHAESPHMHLLICSVHSHPSFQDAAVAAGAEAFLSKKDLARELLPLLHRLWGEERSSGVASHARID
ncbi:MAG: response regulator [Terriglobales bacterium]